MKPHIKIGKHEYTERQKRILELNNIDPDPYAVYEELESAEDVDLAVSMAHEKDMVIVVTKIPSQILKWILETADSIGVPVYSWCTDNSRDWDEGEAVSTDGGVKKVVFTGLRRMRARRG